MPKLECYSISFQGRRSNNEDSCLILNLGGENYFLAVADGMGGAAGGEIASRLVIDSAKEYLQYAFTTRVYPEDMKEVVQRIFELSQKAINDEVKAKPELSGMGSTLTCVLILDDEFVIGNLGDSRVYLLKKNTLQLMTEDHTYIQEAQKELGGNLDPNIAGRYSNYLIRSIDGGDDKPDIFPKEKPFEKLSEGEAFLLCSDGLITDKIKDNHGNFKDYILGTNSLKDAIGELISLAYTEGSKDNITVVLAQYGELNRSQRNIVQRGYPPPKEADHKDQKSIMDMQGRSKDRIKIFIYLSLLASILILTGYMIFRNYSVITPPDQPVEISKNTELNRKLVQPKMPDSKNEEVKKVQKKQTGLRNKSDSSKAGGYKTASQKPDTNNSGVFSEPLNKEPFGPKR